eukprot:129684-Prorocentrum_minimum.AAC.1
MFPFECPAGNDDVSLRLRISGIDCTIRGPGREPGRRGADLGVDPEDPGADPAVDPEDPGTNPGADPAVELEDPGANPGADPGVVTRKTLTLIPPGGLV